MDTVETQNPPRPTLPLLALLALASALGVAVAIALAGVAMLLAAPAYADDGSLLLERRAGLERAQRLFAETESHEDGHLRVVEAYHNPFAESLVGVYLYRLPPHAVVERLTFNGLEAQHAVLTRRQGAALIERVTEIGPGETLRVELEYRSRNARVLRATSTY
jgi:hypothetical protein